MPVSNIHSTGRSDDFRAQDRGRDLLQSAPRPARSEGVGEDKRPSVEENRQKAFRTIEQTLAMGYEKLAARHSRGADEFAQFEPLSAEKVAGNILGFIERRLHKDAAEGASAAELQERLEQGLAGFEKGFAQAQKQLEALASFTPEIQADIDDTRNRVLTGIDELRQRILDDALGEPAQSRQEDSAGDETSGRDRLQPVAYAYEQARASRFSFELTTAEGDRVTIEASSSGAVSASGNGSEASLSASASRSTSWSVEGDLSNEERSAIASLVESVDSLAEQFYSGDLGGAVEAAQSLGYDQEQIVGFSLNLSQSDIRRVSETYEQIGRGVGSSPAGSPSAGLQERLAPLGQFLRDLETSLAQAESISDEPKSLLLGVGERLAAGDGDKTRLESQSLTDFMTQMLETLSTDSATTRRDGDVGKREV